MIIKEVSNVSAVSNASPADDGPRFLYGNKKTYLKRNEELAGKMGWKVIRLLVGKNTPEIYGFDTRYPKGPVGDVSFAPTGIGTGKLDNNVEREHHTGKKAFKTYKKHIDVIATRLGYEIIDYLGAELVAKHSLKNKQIVDEIPDETKDNRNKKEFKGQKVVKESMFSTDWWDKNLLLEDWWDDMSAQQQVKYLQDNPGSKRQVTKNVENDKKDDEKTDEKPKVQKHNS